MRWPLFLALVMTGCAPVAGPAASGPAVVASPSPTPIPSPSPSPSLSRTSVPSAASGGVEVFATGPLHGTYVWVVASEPAPQDRVTESLYAVPLDGSAPKLAVRRLRDATATSRTPFIPFRQLSPDGTKLALERSTLGPAAQDGFVVVDLVAGRSTELARGDARADVMPAWSPDGSRIAFARWSGTPGSPDDGLWVIAADGTGLRRIEPGACCAQLTIVYGWTADGAGIAFALAFEGASYSIANATTGTVTGPHGEGLFSRAPADWRLKVPQFAAAFSEGDKGGEQRIDVADGVGAPQRAIRREPSDLAHGAPILRDARWSPVADEILFVRSVPGASKVVRLRLADGVATDVALDGEPSRAEWLPDGRIAYLDVSGTSSIRVASGTTSAVLWRSDHGRLSELAIRSYP